MSKKINLKILFMFSIMFFVSMFYFSDVAKAETWTDSNGIEWDYLILDYWEIEHLSLPEYDLETYEEIKYASIKPVDIYSISGRVEIPSKIDGYNIIVIDESAFDLCEDLTEVIIPEGVLIIEDFAFNDCENLTEVTLPDTVTSIGKYAFSGCSLTEINLPNTLISIGEGAFNSCSSLTKINLPNTLTSIEDWTFGFCSSLTEVTLPDTLITIGESAFHSCNSLTKINLPNTLTSIGNSAFDGCKNLTEVTFPNTLTSIGKYAFSNCNNLKEIIIPANVEIIGANAFGGFGGPHYIYLETIYGYPDTEAETYALDNNIMFVSLDEAPEDPEIPNNSSENTKVDFKVVQTIISVEIPMTAYIFYDPNTEDGFVPSDLIISSNTRCPVKLSVNSITSLDAPFTENILPDELPEGKTWDKLNLEDSLKYIAFGISAPDNIDGSYGLVLLDEDLYAKELINSATSVDIGVIYPNKSCNINLTGLMGKSFKTVQSFEYQIVFEVELY